MALGESPKFFFKKHFCVVANGGMLCLGKTTTIQHELFFEKEKEVSLPLKKLCEFQSLLHLLGKNFAFQNSSDKVIQQTEIAPKEAIYVKGKVFGKVIDGKTVFEIKFDQFCYINLLFAIRDTCLFICHPTKMQYNSMIAFYNAKGKTPAEKISEVCKNLEEQSEMQRFMLEQFLLLNSELIDFYSSIRALLQGRQ